MERSQRELSSKSSNFFRVILSKILAQRTLELPTCFVEEHGKYLSKYVHLKMPTGEESKVELKWRNGRAWLHKGWQDFVDKYSIQCGYFLVFKYKGRSRFNVIILDWSTTEIKYPVSSAKSPTNNDAGKRLLIEVKKEDDDDGDEISDEYRELQLANESRKSRSGHHIYLTERKSVSADHQVIDKRKGRERAVERAKAFDSPNPHFTVIMQPSYVSRSQLYLPKGTIRAYLCQKGNGSLLCLKAEDGRAWPVKYNVEPPPRQQVRLSLGWSTFVQENHLQAGDVCAFELINKAENTFKVTIFRSTDEEEVDRNRAPLLTDAAPCAHKTSSLLTSNAMERVQKRAESLKCKNPHFMIRMTSYYVSSRPKVNIPSAHAKSYLNKGQDVVILHGSNGETWPVHLSRRKTCMIVQFGKGWKDFASDNRLQAGDVCVFEIKTTNGMARAYKVTIVRVADHA